MGVGYDRGYADGACDAGALRLACEQALYWLEAERQRPGQAFPDEIIRVLREVLA